MWTSETMPVKILILYSSHLHHIPVYIRKEQVWRVLPSMCLGPIRTCFMWFRLVRPRVVRSQQFDSIDAIGFISTGFDSMGSIRFHFIHFNSSELRQPYSLIKARSWWKWQDLSTLDQERSQTLRPVFKRKLICKQSLIFAKWSCHLSKSLPMKEISTQRLRSLR